ncbi:MAG: ATP-binding cassette domain-containing protein [Chloroflexota bacterium]
MIELNNVTYHYPNQTTPALRDVSLKISAGSFWLLVGQSGAGKSTLLRCLNGLVPHFYGGALRGRVRVGGRDPVALGPRGMSDLVGFAFQDPESQFVTQRVEDELAFAMENRNFDQTLMRRRIEEVLAQLSIADLRARRVDTLSGGQQQLVAIASVLTLQPSVLALDEPTSQLDPQAAEEVLTILQRLNLDLGLTIVIAEHRLERVAQYADRICYLPARGEPPIIGDPRAVLSQVELAPPLAQLGRRLDWQPLPLTIKEGRPFAERLKARLDDGARTPIRVSAPLDTSVLTVRDVWFSYDGRAALSGVNLQVYSGEIVALMGRNGAGKSTLLKNIVGLLKPQRGKVTVLGMDVHTTDLAAITRRVGFVPQNPGRLLFNDTLEQELRFTCRAHNLPPTRIDDLLAQLGLREQSQAYPRDLSVGERQRAALAAILVAQPQILLLDEPTRGLDCASKEKLRTILAALRQQDVTIILATHDVELVAQCADRVILLGDGEVIVDGATRAVMTDSLVFASQINKLLRDDRFLTVADVLARLGAAA